MKAIALFLERFMALAVAGLLLVACLPAPALAGLVRIPVERSVRRAETKPQDGLLSSAVQGGSRAAGLPVASGALGDVELVNVRNIGYSGKITVGTPGQVLTVIFDTGSANTWIPSSHNAADVGAEPSDAGMHSQAVFATHTSSTFVHLDTPFHIEYGSGSVTGVYCQDRFAVGDVVLDNFTFAEVADTSHLWNYEKMHFDGIVGMGFPAISDGAPTLMGSLVASGLLDEPVFGFYLGDDAPGQLVLGGVDPDHYVGEFQFANVTKAGYWEVQLDGVSLGDHMSLKSAKRAIVDSGTSLLTGPPGEVRAIAHMLNAELLGDLYVVFCNATVPDLTLTIAGRDYAFSFQELIVKEISGFCALGIQEDYVMEDPMWILGDVFMRKYYVQFDWERQRVGFALAKAPSKPVPDSWV